MLPEHAAGEPDSRAARWVVIALAVLAIVALLAYDRGQPGDDGRAPTPEDAAAVIQS